MAQDLKNGSVQVDASYTFHSARELARRTSMRLRHMALASPMLHDSFLTCSKVGDILQPHSYSSRQFGDNVEASPLLPCAWRGMQHPTLLHYSFCQQQQSNFDDDEALEPSRDILASTNKDEVVLMASRLCDFSPTSNEVNNTLHRLIFFLCLILLRNQGFLLSINSSTNAWHRQGISF